MAEPTHTDPALGERARRDADGYRRTPRWPLFAIAAGFVVLYLSQSPGKLTADTKLDVPLAPLQFLGRATHLWNSSSDFGFLPNQYVGYLFPMGPFFLVGKVLHLPPWITQRLWMAFLLTVAAWGVVRLADAMRVGRPWTRVVGGLGYALSPIFLTKIGSASVALTGAAMLPWITLPLVLALRPGGGAGGDTDDAARREPGDRARRAGAAPLSPRRAAALSGFAVFCAGGVNASVTLCVLLCPGMLLLLAGWSRRAWALRVWWVISIILATAWWLLALLAQNRYGLNFLPYTETAEATTAATSVAEALRGTADWMAYLRAPNPWLPAATASVNEAVPVVGSAVMAGIGLWGLARRDLPGRRFLLLSLAVGVIAVCAAYPGQPTSPLAGSVRALLADQLAFLRNVYKFQPVAHLPLALGMAHALSVPLDRGRVWRSPIAQRSQPSAAEPAPAEKPSPRVPRDVGWLIPIPVVVAMLTAAALVTAMTPTLAGRSFQSGSFTKVPDYWHEAADWLAEEPASGRTLLLPGIPFAEYEWGRSLDEPLAWLASTPWASRALVPLGQVGMTRWMDGIEQALARGSAPGLAAALARAGVGQVLVRNDIDDKDWDIPPSTEQVHRALESSGLRQVATFGPSMPERPSARQRLLPETARPRGTVPALEVWAVPDGASTVTAYPADTAVVVSGGAEATVQLAAQGVLGADRAVILASDLDGLPESPLRPSASSGSASDASAAGPVVERPLASEIVEPTTAWMVTDTFKRRDYDFGVVHRGQSYLLGPDENTGRSGEPPHQWADGDPVDHQTVAGYSDGVKVSASSYGSPLVASADVGPYAAVDGLSHTYWNVASDPKLGSVGGWIQVDTAQPVTVPYIDVQLLAEGRWRPKVRTIRVTTAAGTALTDVRADESIQRLAVPPGPSSWYRLTFERVIEQEDNDFSAGIREIAIPGVPIQRYAQAPADAAGLFTTPGQGQVIYSFERDRVDITEPFGGSEEQTLTRRFDVPRPMRLTVTGTMQAVPSGDESSAASDAPFAIPCGEGPALLVDGTRYDLRVEGTQADVAAALPLRTTVCAPDGTISLDAGPHLLTIEHAGEALLVSSLTLVETDAAASGSTARSTSVTSWSPERRVVSIAAGGRAFLAVRENANESWTASLDGAPLRAVRLDGWQQGWIVPAGEAGSIVIENKPGHEYRRNLVVGGLLVLVLLALALVPARSRRRRSGEPDDHPRLPGPRRPSSTRARLAGTVVGCLVATVAVFLVAGPVALAVPVLTVVGLRLPWLLPWTGLLAMTAAGIGVALGPDAVPGSGEGPFSWPVQAAGALAFAAALANLVAPAPPVSEAESEAEVEFPELVGGGPRGSDPEETMLIAQSRRPRRDFGSTAPPAEDEPDAVTERPPSRYR
ncbi:alpha-(1-_3)-arabinofuranosyltransferase domain-containing protein [Frankia nepalensis]|nr:alpha-(1->3)-arabinofuranosyltransferase family protein [Frankia nepalensis]